MNRWRESMPRTILGLIGITLVATGCLLAATQEPSSPAPTPAATYRTLLNRYCVTCHNEKLRTAGLALDRADIEHIPAGAEVWEKVIRKLRTGSMPPAGLPRPDKATYDSFPATWKQRSTALRQPSRIPDAIARCIASTAPSTPMQSETC